MTITVTPTVEGSNIPPRIRLNIAASGGETSTTVIRLDPDGSSVVVRTSDGNPAPISGGTALVYDYEAPFGQIVNYTSVESPATISANVTVDASSAWLIHPNIPSLSMPVDFFAGSFDSETWDVQQAILMPMGRKFPWTATDGQRKAPASSFTIAIASLVDLNTLETLLSDTSVLLMNIPVSLGFGVDTAYIAVGSVSNGRQSDIGNFQGRRVTIPYQVVDRPAGGSQSQRTWADVVAAYSTWTAVKTHYSTWAAVNAGP